MVRRSAARKVLAVIGGLLLAAAVTVLAAPALRARAYKLVRVRADLAARVAEIGPAARERMRAGFAQGGVAYPPTRLTLVGLKAERRLEVYAPGQDGVMRQLLEYPILGASGRAGPKLRAGDLQVPEGVYTIESLNPNSLYHVALRIGYPSAEDRARAREDGRETLGGDIMIHGGAGSVGCLAMGDAAAEELFVLAADVGLGHIEVLLCPVDLRSEPAPVETTNMPMWMPARYAAVRSRLGCLVRR